ncbi:MAG: helix-turn-helix transcriptional regulator [Thalassolituus sp.]|jgi:transcriptional regulator with XRE-family HTH domain
MSQLVTYNSLVGYELERLRRQKGVDQADLAESCGISQPVLSRLERGKAAITIDQLFIICESLAIEPFEVIANASRSVAAIEHEETLEVKSTKEAGAGTALLTGAAVGAVLAILLSKK